MPGLGVSQVAQVCADWSEALRGEFKAAPHSSTECREQPLWTVQALTGESGTYSMEEIQIPSVLQVAAPSSSQARRLGDVTQLLGANISELESEKNIYILQLWKSVDLLFLQVLPYVVYFSRNCVLTFLLFSFTCFNKNCFHGGKNLYFFVHDTCRKPSCLDHETMAFWIRSLPHGYLS